MSDRYRDTFRKEKKSTFGSKNYGSTVNSIREIGAASIGLIVLFGLISTFAKDELPDVEHENIFAADALGPTRPQLWTFEPTPYDPCRAFTTDPVIALKCALGKLKADRDAAARAVCEFKKRFQSATWQKLGFDCL